MKLVPYDRDDYRDEFPDTSMTARSIFDYHRTRQGLRIQIVQMEYEHLENMIGLLLRPLMARVDLFERRQNEQAYDESTWSMIREDPDTYEKLSKEIRMTLDWLMPYLVVYHTVHNGSMYIDDVRRLVGLKPLNNFVIEED